MKQCSRCGETKPLDAFNPRKRALDGYQVWCAACFSAYAAAYYLTVRDKRLADYDSNKAEIQRGRRLKRYGISEDVLADLLSRQGGVCAGCGGSDGLQVDHDHSCCGGKAACGACVRGLLCPGCNKTLGFSGDSVAVLNNLSAYVTEYNNRKET